MFKPAPSCRLPFKHATSHMAQASLSSLGLTSKAILNKAGSVLLRAGVCGDGGEER